MTQNKKKIAQVWRSAQLFIGFHRDQSGKRRETAKVWPPKNGNATIHSEPDTQEAFVVVKAAEADTARDVQIKLRPNQIVLRRDAGPGWDGIIVDEHSLAIQVNGTWIRIKHDGSVSREVEGDTTHLEANGEVWKKTPYAEAMMSGDGVELSRRTETMIAAIRTDGVFAKARDEEHTLPD